MCGTWESSFGYSNLLGSPSLHVPLWSKENWLDIGYLDLNFLFFSLFSVKVFVSLRSQKTFKKILLLYFIFDLLRTDHFCISCSNSMSWLRYVCVAREDQNSSVRLRDIWLSQMFSVSAIWESHVILCTDVPDGPDSLVATVSSGRSACLDRFPDDHCYQMLNGRVLG